MKKILLTAIVSLTATQTMAATVRSAKLDSSQKNLLIDVTYAGGCGKHDFSLKTKGCFESMPVQCEAELIEKTTDSCEALVGTTVVINLAKSGLTGTYFRQGTLTITGDQNWQTKKPSAATVQLP